MFESKPMKVTIVSDLLCYGPAPEPGDEISQRITINHKGQVWFKSMTCNDHSFWDEVPLRKAQARINTDVAVDILNRIIFYFQTNRERCFVTDVGSWEMKLALKDGSVFKESGSMYCCPELNEISNIIRSALPDLGVKAFGEDYDEDQSD